MSLPSILQFGYFRAFVAVLFVHASCVLAASVDDKCDTSSLLQASLGTVVRSTAKDGAVHRAEGNLDEVKPALLQAEKRLDALVKSRPPLSIRHVAEHRQPEDDAASPGAAEQQQLEGDAASPTVAEQQQPEGDAANPAAAEQQQPEGDEQQQAEADAANPTVAEQQQPEGDASNSASTEQEQGEGDAAIATVDEQQQPEGDATAPLVAEEQQAEGDAATPTVDEQQQPEGDAATPTVAEQQQPEDDNISLVPNTSDWLKEYPFEEPHNRPWQWYATGIGFAMVVLTAAAVLRR